VLCQSESIWVEFTWVGKLFAAFHFFGSICPVFGCIRVGYFAFNLVQLEFVGFRCVGPSCVSVGWVDMVSVAFTFHCFQLFSTCLVGFVSRLCLRPCSFESLEEHYNGINV
jgi:hypothetical protein